MDETQLVALRFERPGELAAELFKAWDRGEAVLPLDPSAPPAAATQTLEAFRPTRLIGPGGETALPGAEPVGAGVALVMPTSGSTGPVKGVELSHSALRHSAEATQRRLGHDPAGRWLCCLPPSHVAGLMTLVRSKLAGSTPIIHDGFDVEAVRRERGATLTSLVPATLTRLLDAGVDLAAYAVVLLGGGPVPSGLLKRAAEAGVAVVATYGMTETCGGCVYDGLPLDGVEVKVAGEQILIRGPVLFSGYRLQPEVTSDALKDGWFHSRDQGRLAEDGSLEVLGRTDDIIITGGLKVSASEVERLLCEHPRIAEAAAVGIPSEVWGQTVAAAVVTGDGPKVRLEEIREFVSSRAAPEYVPRKLVHVDSVPKTANGKVRRPALVELLSD